MPVVERVSRFAEVLTNYSRPIPHKIGDQPNGTAQVVISGSLQVIFAADLYQAVKVMRGDPTPRPALVVLPGEVIEAETQVFPSSYGDAHFTFGSIKPNVMCLVRFEGNRSTNAYAWTTAVQKLGLVIYCTGDFATSGGGGGIRMDALVIGGGVGVIAQPTLPVAPGFAIAQTGAAGGAQANTQTVGNNGTAAATTATAIQTGGGGSGGGGRGGQVAAKGGAGAAGGPFAGGPAGGAGAYVDPGAAATSAASSYATGGQGADPSWWPSAAGGGGAGSRPGRGGNAYPGGTQPSFAGETGGLAGGVLLILAEGNVTIGAGTQVLADGGLGGRGGGAWEVSPSYQAGSGGGGSGGGIVLILRRGTYTNNGTVRANGGTAGPAGIMYVGGTNFAVAGGAGGAGAIVTGVLT